ncbi:ParB/RepB/Spo0J family partition protein [Demequina capsici]|uniref:ParB/RepB/Spo0J family partition protein n=1 Tax=Demequina capsici TaxID=3075620 RepID=A0AA96FDM0_9MICO|nr:ParB/RepB/Spo0J family partition protein [Demequina sp. PMTSA13]WNM27520.1 ParB/RepB/Spo0J family partition protein [Demequina sp. PMTSA13]
MTATAAKKPASRKRTSVPAAEPSTSTSTAVDAIAPASHILRDVPLDQIEPHPHNPRKDLGDLTELANSIKAKGILEPVVLVPAPADAVSLVKRSPVYRVIAGHRRTAAAGLADVATVPAIIREDMSETDQLEAMLIENGHRTNLTRFEEGRCMQGLLDLGVTKVHIARRTGHARTTVDNRLALASLPEKAEEYVANRKITLDDAVTLSEIRDSDPDVYEDLAARLDSGTLASWSMSNAVDLVKNRRADEKWIADLDAQGIKHAIHGQAGDYTGQTYIAALGLTPKQHKDCPGQFIVHSADSTAYQTKERSATHYCTDAATHHPELKTGGKVESEKERAKREARHQLDEDLGAACAARKSWIRTVMTDGTTATADARAALVKLTTDWVTGHDYLESSGLDYWEERDADFKAPKADLDLLTLALLPNVDTEIPDDAYDYDYTVGKGGTEKLEKVRDILTSLEGAGYPLSDIEQQLVTIATTKAEEVAS